jgi:pre-rRNA-processing protein IPI3
MLTEHLIASVGVPNRVPTTNTSKDAGIFIHEFQPLLAQTQAFKKSVTPPNCLAVSSTHIFAAQTEKAVVHVYSREKGNLESIVPFTERITCIALACDETVLILGTAEGRIFLWEVASGRQISTSQAHLQAVIALAVHGASNFLLSASKDSSVHVWSLTNLLSFASTGVQPLSPIRSFTSHRAEITALALGRTAGFANIAVTASADKTCLIWDYHTNATLRTYLLPAVPTCVTIDAPERAVYVGYEDGCIQQLDLYASLSRSVNVSKQALAPIQPPQSSLWQPQGEAVGAALSIHVSFDSCTVLSGHESGAIFSWDTAKNGLSKSLLQTSLPGPVTNLEFLPVVGFATERQPNLRVSSVVKPKFGAFDSSNGLVPSDYAVNVEFPTNLLNQGSSTFEEALSAPSFPTTLLDAGLNELMNWSKGGHSNHSADHEESEDFMALDEPLGARSLSLEEQNTSLKAELDALRRLQRASFDKIETMSLEKRALMQREDKRLSRQNEAGIRARTNGTSSGCVDMDHSSSSED